MQYLQIDLGQQQRGAIAGRRHVVVDLGRYPGKVNASVNILPGPPYRRSEASSRA